MKTLFLALTLLTSLTTYAGPPIIWGSPYAKLLTKGVKLSGSDTSTSCVSALAGSIRYNAGTFEGCNGSSWSSLGGGTSGTTYTANQYGVLLSGATNVTSVVLAPDSSTTKFLRSGGASANPSWGAIAAATDITGVLPAANGGESSSYQVVNCSVGVTIASSNVTFSLLDGAGAALSSTSPCVISFRNATAATGTYAQVTTTAASAGVNTVVGANADSLGCPTAAVACVLSIYAINNSGSVNIAAYVGGPLDEGSVQSSSALTGGADTTTRTLWATSALSGKAVRLIARVTITPAAAFAWSNAVTEISLQPFDDRDVSQGTAVRYTSNNAQAIADSTTVIFNFEDIDYDDCPTACVGIGVGTWKYTVPTGKPGMYQICGRISLASSAAWNATELLELDVGKNGSQFSSPDLWQAQATITIPTQVHGCDVLRLVPGDYIDLRVIHTAGSSINASSSGVINYIDIHRISK